MMRLFLLTFVLLSFVWRGSPNDRIKNKCTSLIISLPHTPDDSGGTLDRGWLFQECIFRYVYLEAQHQRNVIALSANISWKNSPKSSPKNSPKRQRIAKDQKKKLIVVDLDETLIYQRMHLFFNDSSFSAFSQVREHNSDALKLSLQQHASVFVLGVFRPKLMEFISKYSDDYDFVLYTSSTEYVAVYYVVMIEMHYNYCYCRSIYGSMNISTRHSDNFYFKSVVFRMDGAAKKSVRTLHKVLDLRGYKRVVIIDDHLYDKQFWDLGYRGLVRKDWIMVWRGYQVSGWDMGNGASQLIMKVDSASVRNLFDTICDKYCASNDTELLKIPLAST